MKKLLLAWLLAGVGGLSALTAHAGIQLGAMRIIYPASSKSVTVDLNNNEKDRAYLVKTMVRKSIQGGDAPFIATPAVFRLEPDSSSAIRVVKLPADLPGDRESLYWFGVVGTPSSASPTEKPQAEGDGVAGAASFGVGTFIKLLYRPDNLPGTPAKASGSITVSRSPKGVTIHNPSPYYVSLASLSVGGKALITRASSFSEATLAPFSGINIAASGVTFPAEVTWKAIGDQGQILSYKGKTL